MQRTRSKRSWLLAIVGSCLLVLLPACTKSGASTEQPATSAAENGDGLPRGDQGEKMAQPVKSASADGLETVILAGGCFWGMEDLLRKVPGVVETVVGYTGGTVAEPSYGDVKTGASGHAESVRVVFDPKRLSFSDLLEKWYFRMHDPTTRNRQGNDVGSQYRSAIFTTTAEQKKVAAEVVARVNESGRWKAPVVTEIVDAGPFTPAEGYHQDYLQKNPGGYTCHYLREWEDI